MVRGIPRGNVGRVGDSAGPREWLESLPPVTRAWFVASMTATTLCSFGLMSPSRLLWSWPMVYHKFEIWRVATPFIFFGGFSFPFLINMYLLVQYSKNYEVSPYNTGGGGSTADYVWMLALAATVMCGACTWMGVAMPAQGLTYTVLYAWSRRNPTTQVSLYGFPVQAVYLPWALCGFNMLIGNSLTMPLMGIAVGHLYYFAIDVVPATYGADVVTTPAFLINMCGGGGGMAAPAGPGFRGVAPPGRAAPAAPAAPRGGHNWGGGRQLGDN